MRPEMPQGYTHIRNGIFEHTATGQISAQEYCLYSALLRFAEFKTGICMTCAESLKYNFAGISSQSARNCFSSLKKKGYIKYKGRDGKRGIYPVLIDKYEPSGLLLGWRLNAQASYDMHDPVYEWVSPTPITKCYSNSQLTELEGASELAQVQVRVRSELGEMQLGCSSELAQVQVGVRLGALYTLSLLTKTLGNSGNSVIQSFSHSRSMHENEPSEEEIQFLSDSNGKTSTAFDLEEDDELA